MKRVFLTFVLISSFWACTRGIKIPSGQKAEVEKIQIKPIHAKDIFKLAESNNAKFTIVNFWASWCQPCRHEFPELLKFKSAYLNKDVAFEFVSVDFEGDLGDAKLFLSQQGVHFLTYIKSGDDQSFINEIDKKWQGALPTTFILNKKGNILFRYDGPVTSADLEKKISELTKSEPSQKKSRK
ncbi:MAG: alkyl hydroperoxide reductase/Thiol specific antioxidant/Mal allergen [Bacteriovoracaceae bacterium]|nr:alkyl hydroperoxide reductase/Thiol specific antioxidant/Mal allergen [Bacteriovoracaceae bacterium]